MRLNVVGVVLAISAGFLVAALVAAVAWGVQVAVGRGSDPLGAVTVGVVVGAIGSGYLAGRFSIARLFNGAIAGVVFSGAVTIISVVAGSPASAATRTGFVVGGLLLGALGAAIAHRQADGQP